jgi:hypothetical protein
MEGFVVVPDAPADARELVGQRDAELLLSSATSVGCEPDIRAGVFRTETTNRLGSGSSNSFGNEIGRCG